MLYTLRTSGEKEGRTIPYALHSQNQWGEGGANHTLRSALSEPVGRRRGEPYLTLCTLRTSGEKEGRTIPYALHSQNQWGEQWGNHTLRSALSESVGRTVGEPYLTLCTLRISGENSGRTIPYALHSQNQNDCSLDGQR